MALDITIEYVRQMEAYLEAHPCDPEYEGLAAEIESGNCFDFGMPFDKYKSFFYRQLLKEYYQSVEEDERKRGKA